MKQLLALFNLSELERRCAFSRGTLSYYLKSTRDLTDNQKEALETFFLSFKMNSICNEPLFNHRELCRQAKISRSLFQRGKEDEKASKFLTKKLKRFSKATTA